MSSRDITVAGYLALLGLGLALQLAARRGAEGVPPLRAVIARTMRTRPGRLALVTGWVWLGLHFFAR
jgi:Family of unknown function (DUF6186)